MKNAILMKIILITTIELRLKIGSIKFAKKKKKDKKTKNKKIQLYLPNYSNVFTETVSYLQGHSICREIIIF